MKGTKKSSEHLNWDEESSREFEKRRCPAHSRVEHLSKERVKKNRLCICILPIRRAVNGSSHFILTLTSCSIRHTFLVWVGPPLVLGVAGWTWSEPITQDQEHQWFLLFKLNSEPSQQHFSCFEALDALLQTSAVISASMRSCCLPLRFSRASALLCSPASITSFHPENSCSLNMFFCPVSADPGHAVWGNPRRSAVSEILWKPCLAPAAGFLPSPLWRSASAGPSHHGYTLTSS